MNVVDVLLVLLVVVFALTGLRQGFLVSVLAFGGFCLGGAFGLWLAPHLFGSRPPGTARSGLALFVVLVCAVTVQTVFAWFASVLRRQITWQPVRTLDALGGALVSAVAAVVAGWLLGTALLRSGSSLPLADQARDSRLLAAIDSAMPTRPDVVFSAFGDLLDTTGFPTVFDDPSKDRLSPVAAPGDAIKAAPGVVRAQASTVKIHGDAPSCNRRLEGSGFVVGPDRVVTNAHVLAGVDDVQVLLGTEARRFRATVVAFDPAQDLAELYVPGLDLVPLSFGGIAVRDEVTAALGYPGDGPLTVSPARVRGATTAAGRDIYGKAAAVRSIYSLRTEVRPGNSGGPLVDQDGRVLGVVFAAAVDDPTTGYALTASSAQSIVRKTGGSTRAVGTGPCA